jgi:hypothetical protein
MKGAIASVEIYALRGDEPIERLSLVVSAPSLASDGQEWTCRVALANVHRPEEVVARDSVEVLARALARARDWLVGLEASGYALYRDRGHREPYRFD